MRKKRKKSYKQLYYLALAQTLHRGPANFFRELAERPIRGPRPGTGRFAKADEALHSDIENIMKATRCTDNDAARQLILDDRVAGGGTDETKRRRLVSSYRNRD